MSMPTAIADRLGTREIAIFDGTVGRGTERRPLGDHRSFNVGCLSKARKLDTFQLAETVWKHVSMSRGAFHSATSCQTVYAQSSSIHVFLSPLFCVTVPCPLEKKKSIVSRAHDKVI